MAKTAVGSLPPEATSGAGLNESTPAEQRVPASFDPEALDDGPKNDPKTGAYLPAKYLLRPGFIRIDR